MIRTSPKHLARYVQETRSHFATRDNELARLAEGDIINIDEEGENTVVHKVPDVLYPYYVDQQDDFFSMTGFTTLEFDHLFVLSEDTLTQPRRGKKTQVSPRDILFLLLNYLRRYPKLEEMAATFEIKASSLDKILHKAINDVAGLWEKKYIKVPAKDVDLPVDHTVPEVSYVVDATVQQINKPTLAFNEAKKWWSAKHHFYCYKSQVITDVKGAALHVVTAIPGATHDITVFRDHLPEVTALMERHPNRVKRILADKGYQAQDIECLLTPIKCNPGSTLTQDQKLFNERIAKVRIIIENFFGRLKNRYTIIGSKYRGMCERYNPIFMICFSLVNFELLYCGWGLRKDDLDFIRRFETSLRQQEERRVERDREIRQEQKVRRMKRYNRDDTE